MASISLSFTDDLTSRRVLLAIVANGKLLSPEELRSLIKRPLELIKTEVQFAQRSHRRQEALPAFGSIFVEYHASLRVRFMFRCVAFACQRLTTAPDSMYVIYRTIGRWAELVMDRVTRGRVKKVQKTVAGFEAAAAARVADGPGILKSAENGDGASVLCHLIVDAESVSMQDEDQQTPLHLSAREGRLEICRLLLQCKADVEAKTWLQSTPLHRSAVNGHLEICRLLLECNADVEANDHGQTTPLHWSAREGHLEISRLLVESKANVAAMSIIDETALKLAINHNKTDVVAYLRSVGALQ